MLDMVLRECSWKAEQGQGEKGEPATEEEH